MFNLKILVSCALVCLLQACGGGGGCSSALGSLVGCSSTPPNVAPVANAGLDQNVTTGSTVTMDATRSSDANNDTLTYAWSLSGKPPSSAAVLSSENSVKPTFLADVSGVYVLRLTVSDGQLSSAPIVVTVIASNENIRPVANAGVDQNALVGNTVTLDGSASTDANRDLLTYAWSVLSKPSGSSVTLSDATAVKPTFKPDVAGTYVINLIVSDGKLSSPQVVVTVVATTGNAVPVANAGIAQNVTLNTKVVLDGSASSDANFYDVLTYNWTLPVKPDKSSALLLLANSAKPTFVADVVGTYVASLTVSDGKSESAPKLVIINASTANSQPVANAGVSQNVLPDATVTLDGSASSDADFNTLTYSWTLSRPTGSAAALSDATSAKPTFVADKSGAYVATLVVNDGRLNSNPVSVVVNAALVNAAPVANAGVSQNLLTGATVTLDGSASTDANLDTLTYKWTLVSKPSSSNATISTASPATSQKPQFIADKSGVYVAVLVVNDGKIDSTINSTTVTVTDVNAAPVANAGAAQTAVITTVLGVTTKPTVTLNGVESTDANGDLLSYKWVLTTKPTGSTAVLITPNAMRSTFIADLAGVYVGTLVVNDGKVDSLAATVPITVTGP
ncbi:PKD domain-containing protein [Limnohabitans sp. 15K]|uniref:PKD domain-containing protein n=1 Tax=Limnohabitans sp. 15K TaxID=1100706 RepID=UPI000C1F7D57|nr:PKD domain-containing protein [Limnohabitans sp. 15K]PIT81355.1 hypothetical protein B9Z40_11520 [Limnohabitans sp. 15K]